MTPSEFKAWFDGFTEAFEKVPTKAQWARVKERVAEIDGKAVTERVFVDWYLPNHPTYPWGYYYPPWQAVGVATVSGAQGSALNQYQQLSGTKFQSGSLGQNQYSSSNVMLALGRADAASLAS